MIFGESEQRMLALLEDLSQLFETIYVISVEIYQHLLATKHYFLVKSMFIVILPAEIDS